MQMDPKKLDHDHVKWKTAKELNAMTEHPNNALL